MVYVTISININYNLVEILVPVKIQIIGRRLRFWTIFQIVQRRVLFLNFLLNRFLRQVPENTASNYNLRRYKF